MGPDSTELPPEVFEIFREEARENLSGISHALGQLESDAPGDGAQKLQREVARRLHSIKGAASSLGFEAIGRVAHAAEALLLARPQAVPADGVVPRLVLAVAWLSEAVSQQAPDPASLLERLGAAPRAGDEPPTLAMPKARAAARAAPGTDPSARPPTSPSKQLTPTPVGDDFVRVRLSSLEKMLAPLSTLAGERTENRYRSDRFRRLSEQARAVARRATGGMLTAEDVGELGELSKQLDREATGLRDGTRQAARALASLEEQIQRARMVSMASLEDGLRLAVRDAAIRTGKQARLELAGGETQLDRRILDELRAPLIHLLRNAVDHGIEAPDARQSKGKPREGLIRLRVVPASELVEVSVEDDGAGIDVERVRRLAIDGGLLPGDAPSPLPPLALWSVLAHPGFSTRAEVSEVSGRGIGMDVVERTVRALGGGVTLDSTPGKGTRFCLTLPLSVLTTRVLFVRAGDGLYALPLSGVEATALVGPKEIYEVGGKALAELRGAPAVIHRLGGAGGPADGKTPAVLVQSPQGRVALLVDEILGEEEVTVRPLGPPVRRVPGVMGTTVAESGTVVVLNPRELTLGSGVAEARAEPAARRPRMVPTVLVVDDSITTRTLERHILERAGYRVRLASDGAEALLALRAEPCDLVVSDLEMPRLDGIGLVRAMRQEAGLDAIPIILVTSRSSEVDRRRGLAAGASAYLVKSQFDQEQLISTVRGLLDREGGPGA
ncbi:MAG: hybrid sensor histidine kinase/response regulator [Myxococcaceae bacterium]